jgi:hypothetical protein
MDDLLSSLENLLSSVAGGDTLSLATNATGEIPVTSVAAMLQGSGASAATGTAPAGLMQQLGIDAAIIIRDVNGNILWQSGPIPAVNPAYAVFGIGALAFLIWLLVR